MLRPSKKLAQHFLIDKKVLAKIIKAAKPQKEETILEIGSGRGILTKELTKRCKKVIAVEKDKRLAKILCDVLKDFKNVKIVNKDILDYQPSRNCKVIGNIPYYITSPILRKFAEYEMVLMVQKEVAQRICAKPPKMNLLALMVQFYGRPKIIDYVSQEAFWPKPKVDSAIIKISPHKIIPKKIDFTLIKKAFSQKRKQLGNLLDKQLLTKAGIDPKRRAESLSLEEWYDIMKKYEQN